MVGLLTFAKHSERKSSDQVINKNIKKCAHTDTVLMQRRKFLSWMDRGWHNSKEVIRDASRIEPNGRLEPKGGMRGKDLVCLGCRDHRKTSGSVPR